MKNKNSFLKKFCGDLSEMALAAGYAVTPDELYGENGCFHERYQDVFNRLYDFAEEQMKALVNESMKSSEIYTGGAFLTPVTVMNSHGDIVWMWTVSQFEDDTYCNGEICSPVTRSETEDNLLLIDNEDNES
jgi:hypothetical protein